MDLGERGVGKALEVGGRPISEGSEVPRETWQADEGLLKRGTPSRFCVPAVRVCLVQELPETSPLIDVGVRRREGGAVHNTEEFQNEREGRGGGEGAAVRDA